MRLWSFLAKWYTSADLARQYQLMTTLHDMKQKPDLSIFDFYSQMSYVWDQLAQSEPQWTCKKDAELFVAYRDASRLTLFLISR